MVHMSKNETGFHFIAGIEDDQLLCLCHVHGEPIAPVEAWESQNWDRETNSSWKIMFFRLFVEQKSEF